MTRALVASRIRCPGVLSVSRALTGSSTWLSNCSVTLIELANSVRSPPSFTATHARGARFPKLVDVALAIARRRAFADLRAFFGICRTCSSSRSTTTSRMSSGAERAPAQSDLRPTPRASLPRTSSLLVPASSRSRFARKGCSWRPMNNNTAPHTANADRGKSKPSDDRNVGGDRGCGGGGGGGGGGYGSQ